MLELEFDSLSQGRVIEMRGVKMLELTGLADQSSRDEGAESIKIWPF